MPSTAPRIEPCGTNCATLTPTPLPSKRRALRRQIGRSSAVGVDEDRGDALRQQRHRCVQRAAEPLGRVRVHVDEARRDRQARCLDDPPRPGTGKPTDGDDTVGADGDVSGKPRVARSVQHTAVGDENVVLGLLGRDRGDQKQDGEQLNRRANHPDIVGAHSVRPARISQLWNTVTANIQRIAHRPHPADPRGAPRCAQHPADPRGAHAVRPYAVTAFFAYFFST